MNYSSGIQCALARIIVAVTLLLGCCGIGRCMSSINLTRSDVSHLSYNDSIMQEVGLIMTSNDKLDKHSRKRIEKRISGFPHKIVRRDTVRYFLQTALAVAYYEFEKKDYGKALSYVDEFNDKAMPREFWKAWLRYSSVGINARSSIVEKGKIESPKDENSWWTPLDITLDFSFSRDRMMFLDSFFDDIPLDGNLSVYKTLLTAYHQAGGKLLWLNAYNVKPGFYQKCKDAGREDIFQLVYDIWSVSSDDFKFNRQNRQIAFVDKAFKPDTALTAKLENLKAIPNIIDSFNPEWNRQQVDSLLNIGKADSISTPLYRLMNELYDRHDYLGVIEVCNQYESVCPQNTLLSLYNHLGLAESYIGKYDEALSHFDKALTFASSPQLTLTLLNNKACALGEAGRYDEAIEIFRETGDIPKSAFDRFCWNDNLGHIYSYFDPATALTYFNNAEHYLDNGSLYKDRKIRHFCRKARVLEHNPYLRRQAIENALAYTRMEFCDSICLGIALTEFGVFMNSICDYENAQANFDEAEKCLRLLSNADRRKTYLQLQRAKNLRELGRVDEAYKILSDLLSQQVSLLGETHVENLPTMRELCETLISLDAPVSDIINEYSRYSALTELYPQYKDSFDDIRLAINFTTLIDADANNIMGLVRSSNNEKVSAIDRLKLYSLVEPILRGEGNYHDLVRELVANAKNDAILSILSLSSNEAATVSAPICELMNNTISQLEDNDTDCENALSLSLFRKGLLFTTRKAVEKGMNTDKKTKKRITHLNNLRNELNFAVSFSDERRISELLPVIASLEREINNLALSSKGIYENIDKTYEQVISHLKSSDVGIDFVRYYKDGTPMYGAFVIRRDFALVFVKLFEGDVIQGEMVWEKLLQFMNPDGVVYFSTDGSLSAAGIEFLATDSGDLMCHRFNLHRVFHLADITLKVPSAKRYTIIGVSDHNSPIEDGDVIDRGAWTDLPSVEYELNVIAQQLSRLKPCVLYNDRARESDVKKLSGSNVSVLHFSSHGFYRSADSLKIAASDPNHFDYYISRRALRANRSNLCGIVLRGGNLSWQTPEILDEEDDLLTSEEIEAMSFPNLQLTVLSACETGLGQTDSDGVWGLQRAFRIAGSKNLICTLNKVDDYWTAQFMEELYNNAANGMNIYDSFHSAHKTLWDTPECPRDLLTSFILIE